MISDLFLGTSALVIVAPGPDAALVTYLVLSTGRRAPAAAAAAGMITAGAGYAGLALSGVSFVLRTQPEAFAALRWCGALVMVAWGGRALYRAFRHRGIRGIRLDEPAATSAPGASPRRWYLMGLLCTGSNPKVGLFLLAYLPQFVPPHASVTATMALLAAVYLSLVAVWLSFLIVAVHLLRGRLAARQGRGRSDGVPRALRLWEGVLGLVFISFAIRLGLG
jgi:threonine/homoserine/homoserine lactone efflux protein